MSLADGLGAFEFDLMYRNLCAANLIGFHPLEDESFFSFPCGVPKSLKCRYLWRQSLRPFSRYLESRNALYGFHSLQELELTGYAVTSASIDVCLSSKDHLALLGKYQKVRSQHRVQVDPIAGRRGS